MQITGSDETIWTNRKWKAPVEEWVRDMYAKQQEKAARRREANEKASAAAQVQGTGDTFLR